ncbi:helix-turn-helix domain-containing protein [Celeribacter sp.]|uniref:helix-turn-helix domain-containing protein n=1 Tax=Celeribacter sp. TaxID=1890673 RepID=UPI003A948C16
MFLTIATAADVQDAIREAVRLRRMAFDLTQAELAQKSGVSLGSLKRFERTGEISFASLLAIAEALDALDAFANLFPMPEATSLDELEEKPMQRKRASSKRKRK